MPERDALTPEVLERIARRGAVDLAVGLTTHAGFEDTRPALDAARAGLEARFPGAPAAVIHVHRDSGNGAGPPDEDGLFSLAWRDAPGTAGSPANGWPRAAAVRLAFDVARRLHARAFVLLDADVTSLEPGWIGRLAEPVLERELDLVAPYYLRHPFHGAVNTGLAYPLVRALYGYRLRYPLGGELACSARLVERFVGRDLLNPKSTPVLGVELRLVTDALAAGFRAGQALLGPRTVPPGDTPNLTGILTELLPVVFAEMERNPAAWQRVRGSVPVEMAGTAEMATVDRVNMELKPLLDPFRLGQQHLREVWRLVLPPSTLVELRKLATLPDAEFRLPDRLWARIVYDFAMAHRQRTMSREHLMGALTPLYLGWLGSFAAEMGDAEPARLEDRLEHLCLQFEAEKPYLISRWRWPDRFNA
jgi:glucosylglycerate synthase